LTARANSRIVGARIIVAGVSGPFFVGALELFGAGRGVDGTLAGICGIAIALFAIFAKAEWIAVLWPNARGDKQNDT